MTEVLLHCCCAPCSSAIIEWMLQNGIRPVLYYCNPNIFPEEEYLIRKNECTRYAAELGLEIVDDDYDHAAWSCAIHGHETEPERGSRCLECFRMRLLSAARRCKDMGLATFTTTLASSRWKRLDQIAEAGHWAASQVGGVQFDDLELRIYAPGSLLPGAYGIMEPTGELFSPEAYSTIDLAVIPGVAFDRHGVRLGRVRKLTHFPPLS